jgi:hypothetical protein
VQGQRHGQCTTHGPQLPRQGEFAGEFMAGEPPGLDLAAGRQDAEGDREVEAAGILRQVGRRQVDRDALVGGEVESGVLDRAPDPLALNGGN